MHREGKQVTGEKGTEKENSIKLNASNPRNRMGRPIISNPLWVIQKRLE